MKCPNCGSRVKIVDGEQAETCEYCGTQFASLKKQSEEKNVNDIQIQPQYKQTFFNNETSIRKGIALLLCFFFGWAGAHKFYEGKIGLGVVYFFTGGLFWIGWFIDFIILLSRPSSSFVYNE